MNNKIFYLSKISAFPKLHAVIAMADTCVAGEIQKNFVSECKSTFDDLLNSDELTKIVAEQLKIAAEGDTAHPLWMSATAEEWFIIDNNKYSLRLFIAKPSKKNQFQSLKHDCLIGNLSGPDFKLKLNKFPANSVTELFSAGLKAENVAEITISKGESYQLYADKDIPDYHIDSPVLTLVLYPRNYSKLVWCFDRESLTSTMATASHDNPVRQQVAANILSSIHNAENLEIESSLATLGNMTYDPHHFVRWSAIQSMCSIDFDYARGYLIKACEDPHPAIAAAAKRAVQQYAND